MKIRLTHFVILFMASFIFVSCLDTDDDGYSYYGDAAITLFTLGTMNQYLYTKDSNGEDSLYKSTYTGSNYSFYIDQMAGLIYNPDSLPYGTDAEHVIVTISVKNNGFVVIKDMDSDELDDYTSYSSTDSIDFSSPRIMRVYPQSYYSSRDVDNYREYTVTLNVHKQIGDTLIWHDAPAETAFKGFSAMKAVACGNNILLFGTDGQNTSIYALDRLTGTGWNKLDSDVSFGAAAYGNVVTKEDQVYLLDEGTLYRTADGKSWTLVAAANLPEILAGAGTIEMYGIGNGNLMVSRDNGVIWEVDDLDDETAPLPDTDISYTCKQLVTNEGIERVMIVGKNAAKNEVGVWTKIIDYSGQNSQDYSWTYVDAAGDERYALPVLGGLTVLDYDDNALALGNNSSTSSNDMLVSRDGGITWKSDDSYFYPEDFTDGSVFAAAVDADNLIWLVDGNTGNVWKGRINRLGWAVEENVFLE